MNRPLIKFKRMVAVTCILLSRLFFFFVFFVHDLLTEMKCAKFYIPFPLTILIQFPTVKRISRRDGLRYGGLKCCVYGVSVSVYFNK